VGDKKLLWRGIKRGISVILSALDVFFLGASERPDK
jgi:hypothetical protein